jgi:hypothetical protein
MQQFESHIHRTVVIGVVGNALAPANKRPLRADRRSLVQGSDRSRRPGDLVVGPKRPSGRLLPGSRDP